MSKLEHRNGPVIIVRFRLVSFRKKLSKFSRRIPIIQGIVQAMRPLTLLLVASLLLPACTAGVLAWRGYHATIRDATEDTVQIAAVLREHALRTFEAQQTAMAWVDAEIDGLDWDQIQKSRDIHLFLKRIARTSPHIDGLWLVRPEGKTVNSADFFPMEGTDVTAREYYRTLRERNVVHIGEMIKGYLKGTLNFNISRRRSPENAAFDGIILVTITLDYFEEFWNHALRGGPHTVSILRHDGEILARLPQVDGLPPRIPTASPFFAKIRTAPEGTFQFSSDIDDEERIYGYAKLGLFPAYMVIGTSIDAVLAPWQRRTAWLFATALAVSLGLAAAVETARRRERRLSEEIARRKQVETTLIAKEEHLATVQRAEAALRESEQRFRTLFETFVQGVVFLDAGGRITSVNPSAERILGVSQRRLVGQRPADMGWVIKDPDGRPLPVEQSPPAQALRRGTVVNDVLFSIETHKGREPRWVIADAIPLLHPGESAPTRVCMLFRDVTEERRAQEAQRILMREVDHRAKNALAVALALVRLTRADTHEDFVRALEGRIKALARAHTLLAHNRWEGADLLSLVREELAAYGTPDGERITLSGPAITLEPYATQPLGMVLHELATNAAKHGALSYPEGRLAVAWSVAPDSGHLVITWKERCGPSVKRPDRKGFGSDLIYASVSEQLGGDIAYTWDKDGLGATITLPATYVKKGRRRADGVSATDGPATDVGLLKGLRVLIVEDNAAVAMEVADGLTELGCVSVGPASTMDQAFVLAQEVLDAAVLDVDIGGQVVFPVAERLYERGVPFVFATGFGSLETGDERWLSVPLLRKPVNRMELGDVLASIVAPQRDADSLASG